MTGLFLFSPQFMLFDTSFFDILTLRLPEAAHCNYPVERSSLQAKVGDKMELQTVQLMAGSISLLFFISSNLPMLWKVFKTKNLRSYSFIHILFNNIGNIVYWLYVSSLPIGPIWMMHTFYTITSILMLVGYIRYEYFKTTHNELQTDLLGRS